MAANGKGDKDKDLITGRIAYGFDGTNSYALRAGTTDASSTQATLAVDVQPTKVIQTELLAPTLVAASAQQLSSTISLTGIKTATIFIDHGRSVITAYGTPNGTEYRVEGSQKASGNDTWRPLASVLAASVACSSIMTGTALAAAVTTITVVSTTTMVAGDIFNFANTTSAASVEWCRVVSVTGTASIALQDPTLNVQASTQVMFNKAEQFALAVDVKALTRMRVVVNNNASGTSFACYSRIACITES